MVVPFVSKKSELDALLDKVQKFTTRAQRGIIKKAYQMALEAHSDQMRQSGEPYFTHPVQVAFILAELNLDYQSVCAGLLHDTIEDTQLSRDELELEFGKEIADLVDAVTKLSAIKSPHSEMSKIQNIRKMILATVKDGRVILVKLADRLHNMRTLAFLSEKKMKRIAQETLDIYAPLAGRFGVYKIKWELEDLCLYYLDQAAYQQIKATVSEKRSARELRLENMIKTVRQKLKSEKIKATVEGRPKHFYSIYHKMKEKNKNFSQIHDLTGIRILVNTDQECYTVLGIIHSSWSPFPGRFKDYISVPKSNGYQSLHTTVVGEDGKHMEFQIRTRAMHLVAEMGIAAHWSYKENNNSEEAPLEEAYSPAKEAYHLLDNIAAVESGEEDASHFMQELKENLTSSEVFVFTPKGDIIALPNESTVLDLAFRIHTDLGLKCAGGKIEGRLVSIRTQLKSGDQVQIVTNSTTKPTSKWLSILKTSHARNKVKSWLRKQEGLEVEEQEHGGKSEHKKASLLLPEKLPETLSKKVLQNHRQKNNSGNDEPVPLWQGESDFVSHYAQCCHPMPGDEIYGFITKVKGISIHKKSCPSIKSLMANPATRDRVVKLQWAGGIEAYTVSLEVQGHDRSGVLLEIVNSLTAAGANILKMNASSLPQEQMQVIFTIEIDSSAHLKTIVESIEILNGILSVKQIFEKRNNGKNNKKKKATQQTAAKNSNGLEKESATKEPQKKTQRSVKKQTAQLRQPGP